MNAIEIEKIATPDVVEAIRQGIATELLKRGFTSPITAELEERPRGNEWFIAIEGEPFQTVPVLFAAIQVRNFSSSLQPSKDEKAIEARGRAENPVDIWSVWIDVNVRYEHFGSGSNGCTLFNYHASFRAGDEGEYVRLFDVRIS